MHFAVVDVGSPAKGNLGWWIIGAQMDRGGVDPDQLVLDLSLAVRSGPVLLGFEAPMYVPAKRDAAKLLKARPGEGSRAWSVAAGAATTTAALAVVPWLLGQLSERADGITAWQDWHRKPLRPKEVLLFEAFVSGGPSDGHAEDARAAAIAARQAFEGSALAASALMDEACFSLLGAALLHAGFNRDLTELHRPCHVIRAMKHLTPAVK